MKFLIQTRVWCSQCALTYMCTCKISSCNLCYIYQVINCYLECYAHTYDKLERHRLAQTITTCLHRRPRYDTEASYFTPAYEAEVKCLKSECQLLQDMINYQLMEERTYNQQTCSFGEKLFCSE